jgi:hypothetical protein
MDRGICPSGNLRPTDGRKGPRSGFFLPATGWGSPEGPGPRSMEELPVYVHGPRQSRH